MAKQDVAVLSEVSPADIEATVLDDPAMQSLFSKDETAWRDKVAQLYRREGYSPDGAPLSLAQRGFQALERSTGIPADVTQAAAAMPIPIATTALGMTAAAPAGPVAAYGAGSMASLAGEEINAALGITEPLTGVDRGIAMAAPLVGPAAVRAKQAGKAMARYLPGAGAGIHEGAIAAVEGMAKRAGASAEDVDTAWKLVSGVKDLNYKQPLPKLASFLSDKKAELGNLASVSPAAAKQIEKSVGKPVQQILDSIADGGEVNAAQIDALRRYFNAYKESDPTGTLKRAAGLLFDDIDEFADVALKGDTGTLAGQFAVPNGEKATQMSRLLKGAMAVTKQHHGGVELEKAVTASIGERASDQLQKFNRPGFIKRLKTNEDITKRFSKDELADMEKTVRDLGYIAPLPYESMMGVGREFLPIASLAAGAGRMFGGADLWQPTMAAGIAVGTVVSHILQSDRGRKWMSNLVREQGGRVTEAQLREMHMVLASGAAGAAGALQSSTTGEQYGLTPSAVRLEGK